MKNIVFYAGHKESAPLSWKNYFKHGYSGTLTSLIEMAHALACHGHKVTILNNEAGPSECAGNLIYKADVSEVEWNNVDVLYTNAVTLAIHSLYDPFKAQLPKLKKNTLILIRWGVYLHPLRHNLIDAIETICKDNDLKLMNIPITPASEDYCRKQFKSIPALRIQNGLNKDIFCQKSPIDSKDKFGHYAFFSCWDRGGSVAERVAKATNAVLHKSSGHYGTGKKAMKKVLDRCDYFVYPLIRLSDGAIHHDVYAAVIHEAMACGVIVITWDIIGLRALYGDNIILLETPPCKGYDPEAVFGHNKEIGSEASVNKFVEKINYLNAHPEEKEALREKAQCWALERTYDKETPKLIKLLDE